MKKRNKKYNPNKVAQLVRCNALQTHKLSMIYDNDVVEGITKEWLETNPKEDVPTALLYPHIQGDLIIAIKHRLISMKQKWNIRMTFELSDDTEAELIFDLPDAHLSDIKNDTATFKIDRGNGLKTRWRGIDKEISDLLKPLELEGLTCNKTTEFVSADVKFNNLVDYSYFTQEKVLRMTLGENVA